jgi:hypothetical protein
MRAAEAMTRETKDRSDMKPTRMNLLAVAAVLGTLAVAAPVSTAGADAVSPAGVPAVVVTDPSAGQTPAVVGPTIYTTAPATFINLNSQVSTGGNSSGGQYGQ